MITIIIVLTVTILINIIVIVMLAVPNEATGMDPLQRQVLVVVS